MKQYLELLKDVLENGAGRDDRTGTGTLSVFGRQMRFDLSEGFPIVTTKKIFWRGIVEEFLWMVVRGSIDVTELEDRGVKFWSAWKKDNGTIGPGYGEQFRSQKHLCNNGRGGLHRIEIDQVSDVIDSIKNNPNSRRHIISLWNPRDIPDMALPPCHGNLIQFYVEDGKLSCQMYQRSGDCLLGVPFNIAFYSLMTHVIAQLRGLGVGDFVHTLGDTHIYNNHIAQVEEQLTREPKSLPSIWINPLVTSIDDFTADDFKLIGYEHHPAIKAPIAV